MVHGGGCRSKDQRPNAVEPRYANSTTKSHVHSKVSASAKPPRSGPTSDFMASSLFGSPAPSSSEIQPSEIFGMFSAAGGNAFDWSLVDIFARTSWYRNNRASWAEKPALGAGGTLCGTIANMSTR